MKAAGDSPGMA